MIRTFLAAAAIAVAVSVPAGAENPTPHSGTQVIQTGVAYSAYFQRLRTALRNNQMVEAGMSCHSCAAKSLGVDIPENRVIMFSNRFFSMQVLSYSKAAGIEMPYRIYVTEAPDGSAVVTYRLASHTFREYGVAALIQVGSHLDAAIDHILADAMNG